MNETLYYLWTVGDADGDKDLPEITAKTLLRQEDFIGMSDLRRLEHEIWVYNSETFVSHSVIISK